MINAIADLICHKGYADAAILTAIHQAPRAREDHEIRELLHHMLVANRFWLAEVSRTEFVLDIESRQPATFAELVERFQFTHAAEQRWLASTTAADLQRMMENSMIPSGQCSTRDGLLQVCLHSHGHRAQAAKLLRALGGTPPMLDFIVWVMAKPRPEWPRD